MKLTSQISNFPIVIISIYLILFTIVLTIYKINYYPLLLLTENKVSSADIILYPSKNKVVNQTDNTSNNQNNTNWHYTSQPFMEMNQIQKWANITQEVKGWSPRWLIPIKIDQFNGYLNIVNYSKEVQIQMAMRINLYDLDYSQIVIKQTTALLLGKQVGDIVTISFSFKQLLNYVNLANENKQQDQERRKQFQKNLINMSQYQTELLNQQYQIRLTIRHIVSKQYGMWSPSLRNGVLIDYKSWFLLIDQMVKKNARKFFIQNIIFRNQLTTKIKNIYENYCPIAVIRLNKRSSYYLNPYPIVNTIPPMFDSINLLNFFQIVNQIGLFIEAVLQIYLIIGFIIFMISIRSLITIEYLKIKRNIWIVRVLGYIGQKVYQFKYTTKRKNYYNLVDQNDCQGVIVQQKKTKIIKFPISLIPNFVLCFPFLLIILFIIQQIIFYLSSKYFFIQYISIRTYHIIYIIGLGIIVLFIFIRQVINQFWIVQSTNIKIKINKKSSINKQIILTGLLLIYYGITAFYFIPEAVLLEKQKNLSLLLNSIFILLFIGMCIIGNQVTPFFCNLIAFFLTKIKKFSFYKTLVFRNPSLKKLWYIFSLIHAFMIFFTTGINLQIDLFDSLVLKSVGASLTFQTNQAQGLRTQLQPVLEQMKEKSFIDDYTFKSFELKNQCYLNIRLQTPISETKKINFITIENNFFNVAFGQYYIPDEYSQGYYYPKLQNGYRNGLGALYNYSNNGKSIIDQSSRLKSFDYNKVFSNQFDIDLQTSHDVVINAIVGKQFLKNLGVKVGSIVKSLTKNHLLLRIKIVNSVTSFPGFEKEPSVLLVSNESYLLIPRILKNYYDQFQGEIQQNQSKQSIKWNKVFVKCKKQYIQEVITRVVKKSPKNIIINQMNQLQVTLLISKMCNKPKISYFLQFKSIPQFLYYCSFLSSLIQFIAKLSRIETIFSCQDQLESMQKILKHLFQCRYILRYQFLLYQDYVQEQLYLMCGQQW